MADVHRIVINGRFLQQAVTGVQRYAIELVRALDQLLEDGEIDDTRYRMSIAVPSATSPTFEPRNIPIRAVGRTGGHLWEQTELSRHDPPALLLSLGNVGPVFRSRQVVTIHDASVFAVPQAYSRAFRTWYRFVIRQLGKRALRILTPSSFSAGELIRYAGIHPDRLRVVHHGADHFCRVEEDEGAFARHDVGRRPFVLVVSSLAPHKNFETVIRALPMMNPELEVISVGAAFPRVFARAGATWPNFRRIGYVTDGELKALYRKANCFVFPSYYEGFGLPPLEAMTCNCPVVVARSASLPEVSGDAALYCDPYDPRTLADAVNRLTADPALQLRMRQVGRAHAARFTWKATARRAFAVIREVLQ